MNGHILVDKKHRIKNIHIYIYIGNIIMNGHIFVDKKHRIKNIYI